MKCRAGRKENKSQEGWKDENKEKTKGMKVKKKGSTKKKERRKND